MIYLDNAATTFPKPSCVWEAMEEHWLHKGGNPGRSGHQLSLAAGRAVMEAREELAQLFNFESMEQVVFTLNATDAINLALRGILEPGNHVVTTAMEHNSVIRPLRDFEKNGGSLSIASCSREGLVEPEAVIALIRPETRLVVVNHVSNLTGSIQPVGEIGRLCREKGIPLMVDAAQSAGCLPIDVQKDGISLLAFTGHKGLFGPQGTGGLYVKRGLDLRPWRVGGTGSRSDSQYQPDFMPDRLEAGTVNAFGLAGLAAGVKYIKKEGLEYIRNHEMALTCRLIEGLEQIAGVEVYGPKEAGRRSAVVSFNIKGLDGAEVAAVLDRDFGIMTRPGIHCTPLAHQTIGTFPRGAVRMSVGFFNSAEEIENVIDAVRAIAEEAEQEESRDRKI